MQLVIKNISVNPVSALRKAGYHFERALNDTREVSAARTIDRNPFPRFHIYAMLQEGKGGTKNLAINLHLDQKKPSYRGTAAHSGEYDGALVEAELERIRSILQ